MSARREDLGELRDDDVVGDVISEDTTPESPVTDAVSENKTGRKAEKKSRQKKSRKSRSAATVNSRRARRKRGRPAGKTRRASGTSQRKKTSERAKRAQPLEPTQKKTDVAASLSSQSTERAGDDDTLVETLKIAPDPQQDSPEIPSPIAERDSSDAKAEAIAEKTETLATDEERAEEPRMVPPLSSGETADMSEEAEAANGENEESESAGDRAQANKVGEKDISDPSGQEKNPGGSEARRLSEVLKDVHAPENTLEAEPSLTLYIPPSGEDGESLAVVEKARPAPEGAQAKKDKGRWVSLGGGWMFPNQPFYLPEEATETASHPDISSPREETQPQAPLTESGAHDWGSDAGASLSSSEPSQASHPGPSADRKPVAEAEPQPALTHPHPAKAHRDHQTDSHTSGWHGGLYHAGLPRSDEDLTHGLSESERLLGAPSPVAGASHAHPSHAAQTVRRPPQLTVEEAMAYVPRPPTDGGHPKAIPPEGKTGRALSGWLLTTAFLALMATGVVGGIYLIEGPDSRSWKLLSKFGTDIKRQVFAFLPQRSEQNTAASHPAALRRAPDPRAQGDGHQDLGPGIIGHGQTMPPGFFAAVDVIGEAGRPVPLTIFLPEGLAPSARVMISGLPAGVRLSAGRYMSAGTWIVPAEEVGQLKLIPDASLSGRFSVGIALLDSGGRPQNKRQFALILSPAKGGGEGNRAKSGGANCGRRTNGDDREGEAG